MTKLRGSRGLRSFFSFVAVRAPGMEVMEGIDLMDGMEVIDLMD